ncbi:unnamed protein product [Mytilus coruscus]|uniref:Uncharacterized protein n=1 Tax=Mytilus coruscus TaxID=42192 RepID=A0A6J8DBI7_MYTCO|nr:unnamed protein product [Mytilus coruscus]
MERPPSNCTPIPGGNIIEEASCVHMIRSMYSEGTYKVCLDEAGLSCDCMERRKNHRPYSSCQVYGRTHKGPRVEEILSLSVTDNNEYVCWKVPSPEENAFFLVDLKVNPKDLTYQELKVFAEEGNSDREKEVEEEMKHIMRKLENAQEALRKALQERLCLLGEEKKINKDFEQMPFSVEFQDLKQFILNDTNRRAEVTSDVARKETVVTCSAVETMMKNFNTIKWQYTGFPKK